MRYLPWQDDAEGLDPISMEEFCDICERIGRFDSESDYLRALPALRQLSMNRDLLNEKLDAMTSGGQVSVSQSILLGGREHFYVRAMLWPSIPEEEMNPSTLYKYAYCVPHDHNFSFMTIGYFGPGYRTTFYHSDRGRREVESTDHLNLQEGESLMLRQGDVAVVMEYDDVHIQYPPASLSVSLNLVPRTKFRYKQAFIATSGDVIFSLPGSSHYGFFLELAELLGSDRLRMAVEAYYAGP